jgi:hypothetical protein
MSCSRFHLLGRERSPSTQRYLSGFYYLFLSRYMFRFYDNLQVEMYIAEIHIVDNGYIYIYFRSKMAVQPKRVAAKE